MWFPILKADWNDVERVCLFNCRVDGQALYFKAAIFWRFLPEKICLYSTPEKEDGIWVSIPPSFRMMPNPNPFYKDGSYIDIINNQD